MSRRGNDLVRRYLWMAALSAVRCNPAVRALYARVVAKHPDHKAIAIGHAMRKLLHLVFAVWKTRPAVRPEPLSLATAGHVEAVTMACHEVRASDNGMSAKDQAAGHKPDASRRRTVVTAACADSCSRSRAGRRGHASSTSPTSSGSCRWRGCSTSWA